MPYVYDIRLPREEDAATFGTFLEERYIPAVEKGPTRVGAVRELVLLQRETTATSHRFLLIVRWSGVQNEKAGMVRDGAVLGELERLGATVELLDDWHEVARWLPNG
jgi:hypothetical protein